jgi:LmbE family N-acetylglucosaminyl deacetylase
MGVSNVAEALARARAALQVPTTYWLGQGGFNGGTPPPTPGTLMKAETLQAALDNAAITKHEIHAKYMAGLAQLGRTVAQMPRPCCDCSGFITWVLGIPRKHGRFPDGGWVNTDTIHADAQERGARVLFTKIAEVRPGALLVYPKDPLRKNHVGHIGIVSAVEGGQVRVIHCAPENMLIPLAPGADLNAIADTDRSHFDAEPATIVVWFNGLAR